MKRRSPPGSLVWAVLLLAGGQSALDRGAEALRKQDPATAERQLREAVREQPSNVRALTLLGIAYIAQEKYPEAEDPLQKACALDRRSGACYYLGRVLYFLNRYEESRKALEIALRFPSGGRGRVLHGLALTLAAVGENEAAERNYKAAIREGYSAALIDYGMFLFHQGRWRESIVYLEKANATEELQRVKRAVEGAPAATAGRGPAAPVRFEAYPLPMTVKNGAFGAKHQVETMLAGVAVFDYNNDGWPDIYVANGASIPTLKKTDASFLNRLFRNQRGTFADVTEEAGVAGVGYAMGVAAADYDNDGCVDLFVTGVDRNVLYRNRCDGSFEDVTARAGLASDGRWSIAAGWFDYDTDGLLDLFLVRYCVWDPVTEPYCGQEKPGYRMYCHPKYYAPLPDALYHNEGNGRFRDVSLESGIGSHLGKGMGVAFGDYDGDGRLDVFVANDSTPNFLFHNEGGGKFREVALESGVAYNADGRASSFMGADFRDFDNDGREDLFITNLSNERFSLFRNTGRNIFSDMSGLSRIAMSSLPWSGWSTGMFDFNNDGLKDLFVAGGHVMDNAELESSLKSRQPNLVFVNQGDGGFEMQALPGEALHRGAAFGDFDRDGRVDAVVTRLNEPPVVLRNVTPAAGHWLTLSLKGEQSNRDGIGARVELTAPSGKQWNRAATSVGYAGSSDRTIHFGLGKDTRVVAIEIQWPSGARRILHDVPVDRYLTVTEAGGSASATR
jgi:Tfp pilus assembly protein PilF